MCERVSVHGSHSPTPPSFFPIDYTERPLASGRGGSTIVCQPLLEKIFQYPPNDEKDTSIVTGTLEDVVVTSDLSYPHFMSSATVQVSTSLSPIVQLNIPFTFCVCGTLGCATDGLRNRSLSSFLTLTL